MIELCQTEKMIDNDLNWNDLNGCGFFTWTLQVPIQFWQHGVADIRLHTEVRAGSVLDYACDEPTLPPYLTLIVKGAGSSEVTADMNFFREYNKLFYENFIYIAATHTFSEYGHSFDLFWFGYSS